MLEIAPGTRMQLKPYAFMFPDPRTRWNGQTVTVLERTGEAFGDAVYRIELPNGKTTKVMETAFMPKVV